MQIDIFGNERWKVNFHTHTNLSDGKLSPTDALKLYKLHGYDAVALTDHWKVSEESSFEGMSVISGVEYNTPGCDAALGLYHVLGIAMDGIPTDDEINRDSSVQEMIDGIKAHNGLAVLAHPAWSLNTPEMILNLRNVDATEVYNTISGVHMSRRPDSGLIVDMVAMQGKLLPLLATDDVHCYDSDAVTSFVMCKSPSPSQSDLVEAVMKGDFYATQGPEVHIFREGDEVVVRSSPVKEVVFHSNLVWSPRVFIGDGLEETRYKIQYGESFIRAEVTDFWGRKGWTNFIKL